ncbi:GMC family oxidoreductase [Flexivirga caeni]|uniref:GMC oxidoreductase n=1 Tax=Flexivirga caeni TaxID=2294115 RepID=UPI0013155C6B
MTCRTSDSATSTKGLRGGKRTWKASSTASRSLATSQSIWRSPASRPNWSRAPTSPTATRCARARKQAWGHHACGTAKIGRDDDSNAVLDGNFRVRGVTGLRVVDASIFPDIPGFFIASAVYMVSEKASDVLLAEYGRH